MMEKWTSLIKQILTSTFDKPGTILDTVDSLGNKELSCHGVSRPVEETDKK